MAHGRRRRDAAAAWPPAVLLISDPQRLATMAFAHSRNQQGRRHDLAGHLWAVAELASQFAANLGAPEAARWLGRWHDLGKYHPAFQSYLAACEREPERRHRTVDHKAAGTRLCADHHLGPLAFAVQGHHGGLRDQGELRSFLAARGAAPAVDEALRLAEADLGPLAPESPLPWPDHAESNPRAAEMLIRLVFSALVDADFLDTERHFQAGRAERLRAAFTIQQLWDRFERDQQRLMHRGEGAVDRARCEIYRACLAAAEHAPGLFRLAVPTGGGKTRSAMGFALKHALRHGLQRVIVAVPFISITEQTAALYRCIFEDDPGAAPAVLEHHSAADWSESGEFDPAHQWARLAAENWDAPIVVTTTVQLFESLFSNRTSAARKLHRLARSVTILDEAQALPPHLLEPILDALRELCAHYGATVVLSTATQPAFEAIPAFAGLRARDVVPEPARYFAELRRVTYEWRTDPPLDWPEVADLMHEEDQALAVVNTKRDAMDLLDALSDPDALHLSTSLCGAHRRWVIDEVRRRLAAGEPCRLVSTQVIEAGVDLDFPLVLRALGPLDAIIQAAGRCNREGRLESGRVIAFRPVEDRAPRGAQCSRPRMSHACHDPDFTDRSIQYGFPQSPRRIVDLVMGESRDSSYGHSGIARPEQLNHQRRC